MLNYIRNLLHRFQADTRGATTVEFMVAMPLIVFWFAGTFTFFDAYANYTRSVKATYVVADILSRQDSVDDDFIDDMNGIYANIMGESTNNTWVRVSTVERNGTDLELGWSTATGIHDPLQNDEEIPEPYIPDIVNGEVVIVVESFIPFVPFLDYVGLQARTLDNIVVVSPRFHANLANSDHP